MIADAPAVPDEWHPWGTQPQGVRIPMEADVEGPVGGVRHERTAERATSRNGYRDRTLDTRLHPSRHDPPQAAPPRPKPLTITQDFSERLLQITHVIIVIVIPSYHIMPSAGFSQ